MGTNCTNYKFSVLIDKNYYKFATWVFPDGGIEMPILDETSCIVKIVMFYGLWTSAIGRSRALMTDATDKQIGHQVV